MSVSTGEEGKEGSKAELAGQGAAGQNACSRKPAEVVDLVHMVLVYISRFHFEKKMISGLV